MCVNGPQDGVNEELLWREGGREPREGGRGGGESGLSA